MLGRLYLAKAKRPIPTGFRLERNFLCDSCRKFPLDPFRKETTRNNFSLLNSGGIPTGKILSDNKNNYFLLPHQRFDTIHSINEIPGRS